MQSCKTLQPKASFLTFIILKETTCSSAPVARPGSPAGTLGWSTPTFGRKEFAPVPAGYGAR